MSTNGPWLIDKSALIKLPTSSDLSQWITRIHRGLVRISFPTLLEVGFSARNAEDWRVGIEGPPVVRMPRESATPAVEHRAVEVQGVLCARGQHRAPSVADLLVAATAEMAGLTLLHVDKDFELIAEVTGQPTERLRVPR